MRLAPNVTLQRQAPAARLGLKGPDAPALLERARLPLPLRTNAFLQGASAGALSRCLRLGYSEFLLEQDHSTGAIVELRTLAADAGLRAWAVQRCDFSVVLSGPGLFARLARLCAYDFAMLYRAPDSVVMTLLADISVTLALDSPDPAEPRLRLWTDPGYAHYLEETLTGDAP